LWAKVVKAIHGVTGRDSNSFANRRRAGVSLNIAKTGASLSSLNIYLDDFFTRDIGNGVGSMFLYDRWLGSTPLNRLFPGLYELESNKSCSVIDRISPGLNNLAILGGDWPNIPSLELREQLLVLENLISHVIITNEVDSWK